MTDYALLHALEQAFPGLSPFDRCVYILARARVLRGQDLKPAQRHQLERVLALVQQLTTPREGATHDLA